MPVFIYHGRSYNGLAVTGKRLAPSAESLAGQLFKEGITPVHIEQEQIAFSLSNWVEKNLKFSPVKLGDLIIFSRQMYALTKAGVPLLSAVTRLAETARNKTMRFTLYDIVEHLNAGRNLSTSMQNHPKVFSKLFVNIVRVGENSGQIENVFLQISNYLELEETTRRRVKSAMRYPIFVCVTLLTVMLIINFVAVPAFAKLFARFNSELPIPTKILIATSNFLVNHWIMLLAVVFALSSSFVYFTRKTKHGRLIWHRYILKIPLVGSILMRILLTRFSQTFALILRSGVPIADGIRLVASAMGNDFVEQRIETMHADISRGEALTRSAANTALFSPLVLQMMAVGEDTGQVDEMLFEVASYYEREVDYDLKRLNDVIEPIMLLIIGGMVLLLALAVFLPIWNMMSLMKQ